MAARRLRACDNTRSFSVLSDMTLPPASYVSVVQSALSRRGGEGGSEGSERHAEHTGGFARAAGPSLLPHVLFIQLLTILGVNVEI